MRSHPIFLVVPILLTFPLVGYTTELTPFIGFKVGYHFAQDDTYDHSEPKDLMLGLGGGLKFNNGWSWDIGYQYHEPLNAKVTGVTVATTFYESALRYDWSLRDDVDVYARLGVAYWDMEKSVHSVTRFEERGFSPLTELGVAYHYNSNISLQAGYQYIHGIGNSTTGQYDSPGVFLGLTYQFKQDEKKVIEPVVEPRPIPQEPKTYEFATTVLGSTEFAFDSDTLTTAGQEQLGQFIHIPTEYPQSQIEVIGHTDSTGPEQYNERLSERRAKAVAEAVAALGIEPSRINVKWRGESAPVASNDTRQGRALNRRTEINVLSFEYKKKENHNVQ